MAATISGLRWQNAASDSEGHSTFRDPALEARFRRDGVVVLDCCTPDEVAELRLIWHRFHPEEGRGFETDFEVADPEHRRSLEAAMAPWWRTKLDGLLNGYEVFLTSFLMKWPGEDSLLGLHQDWTYVDERRWRSVSFWLALDDASAALDNGPIHYVPGSHRWVDEFRGSRTPPWYTDVVDDLQHRLVTVDVTAGQAVVMDNAVLHGSASNRSTRSRLAVAGAAAPRDAQLLHPVGLGDGRVDLIACGWDFFFEHTPQDLLIAPPTAPSMGRRPQARYGPVDAPLGGSEPPPIVGNLITRAVLTGLAANHRLVGRRVAEAPGPFYDAEALPWLADLEAAWPDIRAEWDAATDSGQHFPPLSMLLGDGLGIEGDWSALMLCANRRWVRPVIERFPATTALLRTIPGITGAFFSIPDPGTFVAPHRGPYNGVVRAHLGVAMTAAEDDCVLWAGEDRRTWAEGRAWAFDDTFEHASANMSLVPRVSLMIEVLRPIPGVVGWLNRGMQRVFGLHPRVARSGTTAGRLDQVLNG